MASKTKPSTYNAMNQFQAPMAGGPVPATPGVAVGGPDPVNGSPYFGRFRSKLDSVDSNLVDFQAAQKARIAPQINVGYTQPEKQAQRVATSGPISSAFSSAGEQLRNQAARTGSSTALAPNVGKLAQQRGLTLAPALAGLEGGFANARREDETTNANLNQRSFESVSSNELNAMGQRAGLAGQEGSAASTEFGGNENQANRQLSQWQTYQGENASKGPGALQGAVTGGLGALQQFLPQLTSKTPAVVPGVAGAAAKVAGAGAGAIGAGLSAGSAGLVGSAALPAMSFPGVIGGLGAAGVGAGGAAGAAAPAAAAGGGTGVLGSMGAALGAIPLAGQIALGVAGGVLLGKKVFGIGNTHQRANDWVQAEQNQFDSYMHEINMAEQSGQINPQQSQKARAETVRQYLQAASAFAGQGKDQRQVIANAMRTFQEQYGDPSQYTTMTQRAAA